MIISRSKFEKMERELEILRDLYESYKRDRELFYVEHEYLRIAESLLTEDQKYEYYRLLAEHDEEIVAG